jgi:OOP family OmpA-OmpF porin
LLFLLLLSTVAPLPARADEEEVEAPARAADADADGATDHPDVPRFPGFYIQQASKADYEEVEFRVGQSRDGELVTKTLGGRHWSFSYWKKEGARTPGVAELLRNYENAFKKQGGSRIWSNPFSATYKMTVGKAERYVYVNVANEGECYDLVILEPAALKQQIEVSSSEMMEALLRDGFIALRGIEFDTGKDTIRTESEGLLQEIVTLLESNAELRLSIEGHTDNVGNVKANLALSKARAESVRKWLLARGIAAARLASAGLGDTRPVADNRTETGRAQNRRVELVKK